MKHASLWTVLTATFGACLFAAPVQAQATRTWVSGVGDDANPCSRTAPCKTFAGAISKTATAGEINCLDPGGFGGLTIIKSISIVCNYTEGGVLSAGAGVNGFVVNLPAATDIVFLSGLDFNGAGNAQNGLRVVSGGVVHLQNSVIRNYKAANGLGISFQPAGAAELYVTDTAIVDNGTEANGGGIRIQPTGAGGSAKVVLENVHINNQFTGLTIDTTGNTGAGVKVNLHDSIVSGNAFRGVFANSTAQAAPIEVTIRNSTIIENVGAGVLAQAAAASGPGSVIVRFGGSNISNNGGGVLNTGTVAVLRSLGGNFVDANGSGNGPFTIIDPE